MRPAILFLLVAATAAADRFSVSLRLPPGGLSAQEEMQIEYRVTDSTRIDPVAGAAPVIRALARSIIDMPAMPAMAPITETAHPEGVPGEYGIHPVFPHGGDYRLRLFITPPGGTEFQAEFPLSVTDRSASRKPKPRPYYAELRTTPKSPKAGERVDLEIAVFSRLPGAGRILDFDMQHERAMHLMIVRSDLGSFSHEHPNHAPGGAFRLTYTFPEAGDYTLFIDVAPKGAGGQVIPVQLRVAGKKPASYSLAAAALSARALAGPLAVSFASTTFSSGRTLELPCQVRHAATGAPVTDLQPYLGALGHLILVHEDGQTYVHSHPAASPELAFVARFPKPGRYRGWVQLQHAGIVQTGSVIVEAKAP